MTLAEVDAARTAATRVTLPRTIKELLFELRQALEDEDVVVSDRRWKATLPVLRACAYLRGGSSVDEVDLPVLRHMLWEHPDHCR